MYLQMYFCSCPNFLFRFLNFHVSSINFAPSSHSFAFSLSHSLELLLTMSSIKFNSCSFLFSFGHRCFLLFAYSIPQLVYTTSSFHFLVRCPVNVRSSIAIHTILSFKSLTDVAEECFFLMENPLLLKTKDVLLFQQIWFSLFAFALIRNLSYWILIGKLPLNFCFHSFCKTNFFNFFLSPFFSLWKKKNVQSNQFSVYVFLSIQKEDVKKKPRNFLHKLRFNLKIYFQMSLNNFDQIQSKTHIFIHTLFVCDD